MTSSPIIINMAELKPIMTGIAILGVAGVACAGLSTLPTIAPENNSSPNANSESITTPEVDSVCTGKVVFDVSQEVKERVAQSSGLEPDSDDIGGFTVVLDCGIEGMSPRLVNIGIARGGFSVDKNGMPVILVDEQDIPVPVDYLISDEFLLGGVQLSRNKVQINGQDWIEEGFLISESETHTLLKYPADAHEKMDRGEPFDILFYPTAAIKESLAPALLSDKPISVHVETTPNPTPNQPNPEVNPTPFSDQEILYKPAAPKPPQISPTVAPATVVAPTSTPENTPIPIKEYSCPISTDTENMTRLSLKRDIQSGELAKWVENQPAFNAPISTDPSKLDYNIDTFNLDRSSQLIANPTDKPGWTARNSKVLGVCRINPDDFGLDEKNDAYIIISVLQDIKDKRIPQFTITGLEGLTNLFQSGWLNNPENGIGPVDTLVSGGDVNLILKGAKPQGPDDLRRLGIGSDFFNAQNTTFNGLTGIEAVGAAFENISTNNTFSEDIVNFFETTVFHTGTIRFYNP